MDDRSTILSLLERRQALVESRRNREARGLFFERSFAVVPDKPRDKPRNRADIEGRIPIIVDLDRTLWCRLLDFRLDGFYQEPDYFLINQLRMDIYHLENLQDDQFFDEGIHVPAGTAFESSLFGMRQAYLPAEEPWLLADPIVRNQQDLARLSDCDFYAAEPMRSRITFHERLLALLEGSGMRPRFPDWIRGPLGVAENLRGVSDLLCDLLTEPMLAHDLFQCIVEARKKWTSARAEYLGSPSVPKGLMYNDEVQVPMISPRLYVQFLLSLESELHDFHRGLWYWHSCGDATPFMGAVAELGNIEIMHCGPYSDADEVACHFARRSALEICVRPREDFLEASDEGMRAALDRIVSICNRRGVLSAVIRLTAYKSEHMEVQDTIEKVKRWIAMARQATLAAA